MPRSRLGPLAIESKLGDQPSQSSVWRAIHVQHKRAIAVKIFPAPFGGTPEARAAFSAEWESLKKIQHPAIAQCYGGGFESTDAYLAYELIEGETLANQLQRRTKLSWESVLDFAEPIADGLEYLHDQRIIHGDIQPEKIVIAGLSPVLLDVRMDRANTPYKPNTPITPAQLALTAPELLDDPNTLTFKTDLYAFGAVLYLAITGEPPISGSAVEEVRGNIAFQEPIPPAQVVLDCPVWLDKLVMQLLSKNPDARPASAGAVKMALAEVRKRAMSRTGVAEHASSGFSALQMTDQKQRDEARTLLGREVVDLEKQEKEKERTQVYVPWHDQAPVLIGLTILILAILAWTQWPDSENTLRKEAERLIEIDTHRSRSDALDPLEEILTRFPEGESAEWARQQIETVKIRQFLHILSVKMKNNLPIVGQGEELHREALQLVQIGDINEALKKYRSIITVLGDDPKYEVAVDAAQFQVDLLSKGEVEETEASSLIEDRLKEADELFWDGREKEAREIWTSLINSYGHKPHLKPLTDKARNRLEKASKR